MPLVTRAVRSALAGVLALAALCAAGCARSPGRGTPLAVSTAVAPEAAFAQWLGVSSWIVSRGPDAVVVDPFFSRPSLLRVGLAQLLPVVAFEPDVARINATLPRLPDATTVVLVGHGHYDHLMDATYYARQERGRPITWAGTSSVGNVLAGVAPGLAFWNVEIPAPGRTLQIGRASCRERV